MIQTQLLVRHYLTTHSVPLPCQGLFPSSYQVVLSTSSDSQIVFLECDIIVLQGFGSKISSH